MSPDAPHSTNVRARTFGDDVTDGIINVARTDAVEHSR